MKNMYFNVLLFWSEFLELWLLAHLLSVVAFAELSDRTFNSFSLY